MACAACQQVRQAAGATIRAIVTGRPVEARQHSAAAAQALGEKAKGEAARVRALLGR